MGDSGFEGLSKTRLDGIKAEFSKYREDGGTRSFWWFCQNSSIHADNRELIRATSEWIAYSLDTPDHLDLMEWLTTSVPSGLNGLIDGLLIRKVHEHIQANLQQLSPIEELLREDNAPCIAQARDQWKNYLQDHEGSNISFQSYLDMSWEHFKETPAFRQTAPASRESSDDDSQSLGFLETHNFTPEDEESITSLMEGLDAYRKAGGQLPFREWLAGEQRAAQADEPTTPIETIEGSIPLWWSDGLLHQAGPDGKLIPWMGYVRPWSDYSQFSLDDDPDPTPSEIDSLSEKDRESWLSRRWENLETTPVDPRTTPPLTKDGRPIWAEPGYDYVSLKMPMLRGASNIEAMAPKPGAIEFTDLARLVLQAFQILQKKRRRRLFGFIGLPSLAFIWTLIQIIVLIWRNWPESQATTSASTPDKFDQDVIDAVAEAIGKHVADMR